MIFFKKFSSGRRAPKRGQSKTTAHPTRVGLTILSILLVATVTARAADIAFFYALDQDLAQLKGTRPVVRVIQVGTRRIQELRINENRVFALKMASGPVETAISAQALLTRVHCDIAISVGPAGALNDTMHQGDWFLVSEVHALDTPHSVWKFNFDPVVTALFRKVTKLELPVYPVASGSDFISQTDTRKQIQISSAAVAVEMNLEGLAPVCADHRIPLYAIRVISDSADEKASETFRNFVQGYAGNGGKFVANVVTQLPQMQDEINSYPNLRALTHDGAEPTSK